ncbi:MAG TPA: hypothetical protein VIT23_01685 [Terrimicrobiaceae bacterium]
MQTKDTQWEDNQTDAQARQTNSFVAWLLLSVGFFLMVFVSLWLGAPMSVRCERVAPSANDSTAIPPVTVTVERKFLGVIPFFKRTLPEVTGVGSFYHRASLVQGRRSDDIGAVLTLRLGDGRLWTAPVAYAPYGTPPWKMGKEIAKFIENPNAPPLAFWCFSWMLHLAATFLLLGGVVSGYHALKIARTST